MIRKICLATLLAAAAVSTASAQSQRVATADANGLDSLISRHAAANGVPEDLVRRVIKRESGGNPRAVSKGNYGLMQIRLGTARALGYRGTAAGLLDPETNMTYAVKYLAGAYKTAGGNHGRAVHYYAAGYYYAAKRKGTLATNDPVGAPVSASTSAAAAQTAASNVIKPSEKLKKAKAEGQSVASSSNPFTGRLDYY